MRHLSLQSDLEHEIWVILSELTEEHGMTIQDAAEATRSAIRSCEKDWEPAEPFEP